MKKLSIAIALFAPIVTFAQGADVSYKGVGLGATMAAFKAALPDHECYTRHCTYSSKSCIDKITVSAQSVVECRTRNSFGGINPLSVTSSFRDDQLVSITFAIAVPAYENLVGALTERLGAPSDARTFSVQNRAGATLENSESRWRKESFFIVVSRYGNSIDRGFVLFSTPHEAARQAGESESKIKAGSKDF